MRISAPAFGTPSNPSNRKSANAPAGSTRSIERSLLARPAPATVGLSAFGPDSGPPRRVPAALAEYAKPPPQERTWAASGASDGQAFAVSAAAGCRALFPRSRHRLPQHAPDSGSQALQLGTVLDFVSQLLGPDAWVLSPHFPNLSGQLDVRGATACAIRLGLFPSTDRKGQCFALLPWPPCRQRPGPVSQRPQLHRGFDRSYCQRPPSGRSEPPVRPARWSGDPSSS